MRMNSKRRCVMRNNEILLKAPWLLILLSLVVHFDTRSYSADLNPLLRGTWFGSPVDIAVAGQYAYVADGTNGLQVVDISNPDNPRGVSGTETGGLAFAITLSGNYAYL